MNESSKNENHFLTCERNWVYYALITVAGFWGSYTYLLKGNIFCNAQTGNVVLMAMALGSAQWINALYYLIPISSYIMGSFISELVPNPIKNHFFIRWDTLLILIEILSVIGLGALPESVPVQISQVTINFIASMQYNTFRQAEGVPMATTFATNHIRQIGVGLAKEIQHRNSHKKKHRKKLIKHTKMLFFFATGATVGTILSHIFIGKAIWFTAFPLSIIFATLLHADLTKEKNIFYQKPSGH